LWWVRGIGSFCGVRLMNNVGAFIDDFLTTLNTLKTLPVKPEFEAEKLALVQSGEQLKAALPELSNSLGAVNILLTANVITLGFLYYKISDWVKVAKAFIDKAKTYLYNNRYGLGLVVLIVGSVYLMNRKR